MKTIGFIGLGNVGGKLCGSLLAEGYSVLVNDLDDALVRDFVGKGAVAERNNAVMAERVEMIITCLPSPAASAGVVEGSVKGEGIIDGITPDTIWAEMSTTDEQEINRLGALVMEKGAFPIDCPVSGGCHRAATGNISIFAGCERAVFERALEVLTAMGNRILHTGHLGSASVLKVITNYLASVNLQSVGESLMVAQRSNIDMEKAFEAIRISSGNSFVHETEGQVILSGSRDVNFTMDLVLKDLTLFKHVAERVGAPVDLVAPLVAIFEEAHNRYGGQEWSTNVVRRLEDACGTVIHASGFPTTLEDTEPRTKGYEVSRS